MAGLEFFQTVMGHHFYEGTMPALVKQLERLNTNLEALLAQGKASPPDKNAKKE